MMTKTEEEKLGFVSETNAMINILVETVLKDRMKEYRAHFGDFNRVDACMWQQCGIAYLTAHCAAGEMDAAVQEDAPTKWCSGQCNKD